jgi:nicotinamide-nucleotide amidase
MTETLSPALPADVERLVMTVLKAACERELKLVTAESCTGGLLASLLTDIDGCGHAFERGFVTYTDAAKAQQLDVPSGLLKQFGAVSAPVAEAMARGALRRSDGDIALAITGFAGRGAPEDEPGLVYFAAARKGAPVAVEEAHFGDVGRGAVRVACLRQSLEMLQKMVG